MLSNIDRTTNIEAINALATLPALPNSFFKDEENYLVFFRFLKKYAISSHALLEQAQETLQNATSYGTPIGFPIIDSHLLVKDAERRTVRHLLEEDKARKDETGIYPLRLCRNYDLLCFLAMALMYEYAEFEKYAKDWCTRQINTDTI